MASVLPIGPRASRPLSVALVLRALATQIRVLNALILRETKTRYGNHKIGFLWALIEPTVSVAVFVTLFSAIRSGDPSGMPLVPFMLVGFVGFALFRSPWSQMQGAIGASRTLLSFPQVTTFDVILARGVLECAITFFVMGFLIWMAWLLGEDIRVERPLGFLGACALLATLGIGAGFFFASLEPIIPSLKNIANVAFGRPLYFGSGLFYTIDTLPLAAREILLWNPVLHMIELARSEFFFGFDTAYASWFYASSWSAGVLALGLLTHRATRKKAIVTK